MTDNPPQPDNPRGIEEKIASGDLVRPSQRDKSAEKPLPAYVCRDCGEGVSLECNAAVACACPVKPEDEDYAPIDKPIELVPASYKKRAEELEGALRHIQHSASFEGWSAITGSDALGVCEGIANLASRALTEQEKGE